MSVANSTVHRQPVGGELRWHPAHRRVRPEPRQPDRREPTSPTTPRTAASPSRATISASTRDGEPDPSFAGDYDNKIIDNVVIGNGVKGYGAGIGVFAPGRYTASYDNTRLGQLHRGQRSRRYLRSQPRRPTPTSNGNVFTYNTIGQNNVDLADGTDTTPTDGTRPASSYGPTPRPTSSRWSTTPSRTTPMGCG